MVIPQRSERLSGFLLPLLRSDLLRQCKRSSAGDLCLGRYFKRRTHEIPQNGVEPFTRLGVNRVV